MQELFSGEADGSIGDVSICSSLYHLAESLRAMAAYPSTHIDGHISIKKLIQVSSWNRPS